MYQELAAYDLAIADYCEAFHLDPVKPRRYSLRGFCHFSNGDYDSAIADFDEAIRLDPKDTDIHYDYYHRGLAHLALSGQSTQTASHWPRPSRAGEVQRDAQWHSWTYDAAVESSDQPELLRQNRAFATTRWSIVAAAGHQPSPDSKRALESLCAAYWYPLYAYVRRRVPDINEAQDLTQAFFAQLLEKNYVGSATPERGRFRSFLLTAFKHFLAKEWDKAKAQKRGGGRAPISLDFQSADSRLRVEPAAGLTAEQFYDQQWAIALLGQIMERLKGEFDEAGKAKQFEELKAFIIGDHAGTTYVQPAAVLNVTEAAAKKAASRMRRRYRELLRQELAQTVAGPDEVEDEIRNLFATLNL